MIDKFGILVLAVVLVAPPAAQAQAENDTDFIIEYGFAPRQIDLAPAVDDRLLYLQELP